MSDSTWDSVDDYIASLLAAHDDALVETVHANQQLPNIAVSAPQGKFLHVLARAVRARRILEVGTLGGYSAIWMARALPADGALITLEVDPEHAGVARANVERAGLAHVVEIRVGAALDTLARMHSEGAEAFDLTFIDADKPPTTEYVDWAVRLSHPGSLIVVDNVVRDGKLIDARSDDPAVQGMRRFLDAMAGDARLSGTVLQTVGVKGYDGFAIAIVN